MMLCACLALSVPTLSLAAGQRVNVSGDGPQQITVSSRDLNVLSFPSPVLSATSSRPDLSAKSEGRTVILRVPSGPADLVVMTSSGQVYVFELVVQPTLPTQMITLEDYRPSAADRSADPVQHAADYVDGLLEAFSLIAQGEVPKGYLASVLPPDSYPKWLELTVKGAVEYRGPKYRVTMYALENTTSRTYTLRQPEFYTGRQRMIVFDRQVVEPGAVVEIYVVDDTPVTPARGAPKTEPAS
jgi:hypothetical protein